MPTISIKMRLEQLKTALKILKEAGDRFQSSEENKQGEIVILANQIRALVCKGGRNFHPLLLEIAEEKGIKLVCFAPQDLKKLLPILKKSSFLFRPEIIDIKPRERWVEYEFKDWLESEIIIIGQEIYTPNEILRLKADSEASHYDPKISQKLKRLKEIERLSVSGNIPLPDEYVLKTARVILLFGDQIFNSDLEAPSA
jgi:hypothetical protein